MANFEIIMPKMGESVQEATITKVFVKQGDVISEDDILFEIATDKVDSEIPSPVEGKVIKIFYKEQDLVPVGKVVMLISLDSSHEEGAVEDAETIEELDIDEAQKESRDSLQSTNHKTDRFYSPLVKSIAVREKISLEELEGIKGNGLNGRVQKQDLLNYLHERKHSVSEDYSEKAEKPQRIVASIGAKDTIIEMDRLRRIIADRMMESQELAAQVTSMIEVDVENIVNWRNKNKNSFYEKEGVKLSYMPIIIEAVSKSLADYPEINSWVDGYKIIRKKDINIGIAVALPNNNLIVPVIKNANYKTIPAIAVELDKLANGARNNQLKPEDIQDGSFSISNFGTFRNLMGTPILNYPQVAILAVGTIEKKPAVVETDWGDAIAVRHKMFLSLTYDHRVVDGALGGAFLRKLADYLEAFDSSRIY